MVRGYKVRFNLGRGKNFMKWQVTDPKGYVEYYDPIEHTLVLHGCKLRNQPSTANKIYEGANKSVCAWIDADYVDVETDKYPVVYHTDIEVCFNPRKHPHWTYFTEIHNIDNKEIDCIVTSEHRLWDVSSGYDCHE